MEKFRIISLDVWGNNKDGYEVNDKYKTEYSFELPQDATNDQIIKALKDCGYMKNTVKEKQVTIEWNEDYSFYVDDAKNGKPWIECIKED